MQDVKRCVTESSAAECVTNEILANTWRETEYHLDVCRAANSAHIEIY
jgi:hypothetical protein